MTPCTCHRDNRGRVVPTVACRVHHILDCGCVAADHEVGCEWCMAFSCDVHGDCAWYAESDPDVPEDERGETYVCGECAAYGLTNGVIRRAEAMSPLRGGGEASC